MILERLQSADHLAQIFESFMRKLGEHVARVARLGEVGAPLGPTNCADSYAGGASPQPQSPKDPRGIPSSISPAIIVDSGQGHTDNLR
ncbi:unnamed protein product [Linum trigynum]|uniref:Uncharacterized protein n=1 Tax=Linum trigynum TaxID=586398 RepID=A0AAV2GRB6_9ROSI